MEGTMGNYLSSCFIKLASTQKKTNYETRITMLKQRICLYSVINLVDSSDEHAPRIGTKHLARTCQQMGQIMQIWVSCKPQTTLPINTHTHTGE